MKGVNIVSKSKYVRAGGLNTGMLVVPFKYRQGDIYSDSTIGPYISVKYEFIETLISAGISQISFSEVGSDKIDTKTGFTIAGGINFEVSKDWDIALITGIDHMSGAQGESWEHQDCVWYSLAIGFNFTR